MDNCFNGRLGVVLLRKVNFCAVFVSLWVDHDDQEMSLVLDFYFVVVGSYQ